MIRRDPRRTYEIAEWLAISANALRELIKLITG